MGDMTYRRVIVDDIAETEEKWVWVTGYKGMNKDMQCKNEFQYEIGKTYDMDEADVSVCKSGFHLCMELKDVFDFYPIGYGNRFFLVRALVKESDVKKYGRRYVYGRDNKLAAKTIKILRELTLDEIFEPITDSKDWPTHLKEIAIEKGLLEAKHIDQVHNLTDMGYSKSLAEYILKASVTGDGYELAVALNSQPGISMDTKIVAIFSHI